MKSHKATGKTATLGRTDEEFPVHIALLSCQTCCEAFTISFVIVTHVDGEDGSPSSPPSPWPWSLQPWTFNIQTGNKIQTHNPAVDLLMMIVLKTQYSVENKVLIFRSYRYKITELCPFLICANPKKTQTKQKETRTKQNNNKKLQTHSKKFHQLHNLKAFSVHSKHSTMVLLDILHLNRAFFEQPSKIFQYSHIQYHGGTQGRFVK